MEVSLFGVSRDQALTLLIDEAKQYKAIGISQYVIEPMIMDDDTAVLWVCKWGGRAESEAREFHLLDIPPEGRRFFEQVLELKRNPKHPLHDKYFKKHGKLEDELCDVLNPRNALVKNNIASKWGDLPTAEKALKILLEESC